MFYSPLEQFDIIPIYSNILASILFYSIGNNFFNISENIFITNSLIYSLLGFFTFYSFFYFPCYFKKVFPATYWEFFIEKVYILVQGLVDQSFAVKARFVNYFPFLAHIFFFILFTNLIGLTPYGFTNSAFLIQTFTMSCSFLISLTILGLLTQGINFFQIFVPKGIPVALVPVLVIIEIISYISRAFSLAIRLFANMMSGHTLLNILSNFSLVLSKKSIIVGLVPFLIVLAISFLEIFITFLQAYVFMILLTVYFNDAFKEKVQNESTLVFSWINFKK